MNLEKRKVVKEMKVKFSKRIGAYFLDIVLLMLVLNIISPIIPKASNVNDLSKETTDVVEKFVNKEISQEEFMTKTNDISYDLSRATYLDSIVSIMVYLLYFVVLPLFMKGQTLGKKLMKIKIVRFDNKEASANNLLLRSLILYGIASSIINLVLLLSLSKSAYLSVAGNISMIFSLANLVSFFMIIARKDGRGLHDLLGNTRVISTEEGDVA